MTTHAKVFVVYPGEDSDEKKLFQELVEDLGKGWKIENVTATNGCIVYILTMEV